MNCRRTKTHVNSGVRTTPPKTITLQTETPETPCYMAVRLGLGLALGLRLRLELALGFGGGCARGIPARGSFSRVVLDFDRISALYKTRLLESIRKAPLTESLTALGKQKITFFGTPVSVPLPKFGEKLLPRVKFHKNRTIGCWVMAKNELYSGGRLPS